MTVKDHDGASLPQLVRVMQRLLGEGGCPWDREQSFASLRRYVLEEAHEVAEAMDALGDDGAHPVGPARALGPDDRPVRELREELGDLLLQVVFQSELARARGWFTVDDVVAGIADKMQRRHPHVFGDLARVDDSAQVRAVWEAQKAQEKGKRGRGVLAGVPRGLAALLRASLLGEKAAGVGFDWPDAAGPRAKIDEELAELDEALAGDDRDAQERELGDLLFSVVNLARKRGLDAERALARCNARFAERFEVVERAVAASGRGFEAHTLEELDAHWRAAKALEASRSG